MQKQAGNIILIILILFSGITIVAQQNNNYYPNFTSVPGLPTKIATSVFKDLKGFMWFGTENGLYRYDGYEFKAFHYEPNDSTSISGNVVWRILFEDTYGKLWLRTISNELNIYNPNTESFEKLNITPEDDLDFNPNVVEKGILDKDGDIWLICKDNNGIINFDYSTGDYKIFRPNPDSLNSSSNMINSIFEDSKGDLWLPTEAGLFVFNKDSQSFTNFRSITQVPKGFAGSTITDIHEDQNNIFWIATTTGLYKYDPESLGLIHYKHDEKDSRSLCSDLLMRVYNNPFDNGNSLWVITIIGINKFEKSTGTVTRYNNNPDDPRSQAFGAMYGMILDENGMLWIATSYAGAIIYNLNRNPFKSYTIGPFENDPYLYEATSFLQDKSGFLWVGTGYGGLLKYDKQMNLIERYKPDPNNPNSISYHYVYSIYETSDNKLWIGTAVGLEVLNKKTNRFHPCIYSYDIDGQWYRINDILEDSYGHLWIGTNRGLYYHKKEDVSETSFHMVSNFCKNNIEIRKITEDTCGVLWFGTTKDGLYKLTNENRKSLKFNNYRNEKDKSKGLSDNIVHSVYVDMRGTLWLGTSSGLNKYNSKDDQFFHFNKESGLDAKYIYFIEGDNSGNLWLSTEKGIVRFSQLSDSTCHSKLLERTDGAPFNDNYQYKFYKSEEGKIYVGGRRISGNGYYCFHPDSLNDNEHIPSIVITELMINNEVIKLDSNITFMKHLKLRYNQNFFSIKFAALDYMNSSKNEYAYMLEGFDQKWIYSNNRRLANYTNVPPGDYLFRAKGSNNDGLWNEEGVSIKITIFPPPWKTWWAYLLYGIFIVGIIYFIFRYYFKRQQLLHKLALEQVQTEKLEELDRTKSRFFANISHEFRTPLTLILGPMEKLKAQISDVAKKDLDMMQRNANRLQNLINQLLSLSKLESGKMKLQAAEVNIVSLVKRYSQSFESLAKQKKIEFKFRSSEENIPVIADKDKIEKILYNLLSNAFKFTSERGKVNVSITQLESEVRIKVSDSGNGISSDQLPHIFDRFYQSDDNFSKDQEGTGIGLALAKELVELHHGRITVESQIGVGTTFTVFLPIGKKHHKSVEIIQTVEMFDSEDQFDQIIEIQDQEAAIIDNTLEDDSKPLILIVEDNDDLRSYIRSYLTGDYLITEAIDGEMGVKKAIDKIPDLIVSDVMMPKMDGYALCKKLKADERTSHIPIILLTAKAAREDKLEGLETGADDFLSKPFDSEELLVRINNLITQREKLKEKYISWLKPKIEKEKEKVLSLDDKFLIKAQQVVEQNLSNPEFSVEFFANEMVISRVQLHRKLKALTNQSGSEFIRVLRLNKAADLLLRRTGNISETAWDVGFNDPNYFTTSFSKHFGMTPSEYLAKNSKS